MPKAPGQLIEQSTRHAAHLERLKSGNVNEILSLLDDVNDLLVDRVQRTRGKNFTRARLEALIESFSSLAKEKYSEDIFKKLDEQIIDLSDYEADFEVRNLSQGIKVDFNLPKSSQLITAINSTPLNLGGRFQGSLLGGLKDSFTDAQIRTMGNTIRASYAAGVTTPDTIRALQREAFPISKRNLETVVRTSLQHAANQTRFETWRANDDIVKGIQIIATLDGRTSTECRARDGQILPIDSNDLPPYHYNAVMGGEMVTTIMGKVPIENVRVGDLVLTHKGRWKKVLTVMRKLNDTDFIRAIHFNTGRVLKVTDEHPVLVDGYGWVRADSVKVGDKLFENIKNKFKFSLWPSVIKVNPNNYPSIFDGSEVFFDVSSKPSIMASTIDFNSDLAIRECEVPNASTCDILVDKSSDSTILKIIKEELFTKHKRVLVSFKIGLKNFFSVCVCRVPFLHSFGMGFVDSGCFFPHSEGPMVFTNANPFINQYFSGDRGCLRPAKGFYAMDPAPSGHCAVRKIKFSFNGAKGFFSRMVVRVKKLFKILFVCKFNNFGSSIVSDIKTVAHNGYVYNLEVEADNTFIVSDIIVHNCRTTTAAALDRSFDFLSRGETRAARDPETGKIEKVPAKQTYYAWLKNQPKAFQESVLGVKRTKLLRDGGLSAQRFAELQLDKRFKPLTLKEMRELDPVAFEKAGL